MPNLLIWEDDTGQTQTIRFDIVTSEAHEAINEITDHPVEDGVDVSDHVRDELDRVFLVGYVSNTPLLSNPGVEEFMSFQSVPLDIPSPPFKASAGLLVGQAVRAAEGAIGNALAGGGLGTANAATLLTASEFKNRVRAMDEQLRDLKTSKRVVRVETGIHDYDSMLVERVGETRAIEDGSGATFSVDLKQIEKVSSQTVQAPVPAEVRGQITVSQGSKAAQASKNDEKKSEKAKSLAASLFDGAGASLGGLF